MNDYGPSRIISGRRMWDVLRALPRVVQVGLVVAFVATAIYHYLAMSGSDPLDWLEFQQCHVFADLWMCAVASAFTYGAVIRLRGHKPPDREEQQAGWAVTGAVLGAALLSATESLLLNN